jgi:hypothetical protein
MTQVHLNGISICRDIISTNCLTVIGRPLQQLMIPVTRVCKPIRSKMAAASSTFK